MSSFTDLLNQSATPGKSTVYKMADSSNTITETELNECDREPLHLIGHVQGNSGHCMYASHPAGKILAADRDIMDIPWLAPRDGSDMVIGSNLISVLPYKLYDVLNESISEMIQNSSYRAFNFYVHGGKSYAISISSTEVDYNVIGYEIELVDQNENAENFFNTITNLGRILQFYDSETIVKTACDTVFNLLGKFERGMVYRFNDDLSGEIIHEICKENVTTSYMGMRFPSSDIPLSARLLYMRNGLRYIHDVDSEAVPVESADDLEMDLSQCRMRAVSKPHIIYLRNMGVISSLSLAIVVENELWGLFAFHGYTVPYKPSLHQRIACETISSMVSVRLESLIKKAQSARIIKLGECMMNLKQDQGVIHNLYNWGDGILSVVDADILVGRIHDPLHAESDDLVIGDKRLTPKASFWPKVAALPNRELCVMSSRKQLMAKSFTEEECPPCGIVAFREGRTLIVLGRKERSRDVAWAGNPDEPKLRIGGILCPRNSFETFMEKAHKEARAWSAQDLNVITVLRDRICEHSHKWMMNQLESDIEVTNQKYMTAIDRARDNYEFFAHMSHELRTPFHGVMGCLSILHDSIDEISKEESLDLLRTAISSGNHMLTLLNDILDISKNKHLSHESTRDQVIFQSLSFEAIDGMRTLAVSRNIRLGCEITPKEGKDVIITDRTKIIQIVSNTVNNAIKFTGQGGIDVKFELATSIQHAFDTWGKMARNHAGVVFTMKEGEMLHDIDNICRRLSSFPNPPNKNYICITVDDSGCGMQPSELAKMFAPYTQSSSGTSKSFQGTGLGLYICVSLCQQLSGFIACASTPKNGTSFHVGIPVEYVENPDSEPSRDNTPVSIPGEQIVMTGPVMVVDDNKVNVKILNRALKMQFKLMQTDYPIISVEGGAEAIDAYKRHRPSLCIIDYHMPEVDGIAATAAIREYEKEHSLNRSYIVSYTADATEQAKRKIILSGADEIMSKPTPKGYIAELLSRMKKV